MIRASFVVFLSAVGLAAQDDAPLRSGPPAGGPIPALPVFASDGPEAGLEFDVAAVVGDGPGAVLFVHELTRNVAPLVRTLDRLADTYAPLGLTTATVALAADRSEAERRVVASSASLRLARPMVVSVDGLEGPGAWALNRRATLTLVLTNGGKVTESIAFTDTGRQDLERLRALVESVTGALPDSPGELRTLAASRLPTDAATLRARAAYLALSLHWRARRVQEEDAARAQRDQAARGDVAMRSDRPAMRDQPTDAARPAAGARRGAAPEDETLRNLLRAVIRKDADGAALDRAFEQIRTRASESDALRQQAESMFELMLSLGYGTDDARQRAQTQLDAWKKG